MPTGFRKRRNAAPMANAGPGAGHGLCSMCFPAGDRHRRRHNPRAIRVIEGEHSHGAEGHVQKSSCGMAGFAAAGTAGAGRHMPAPTAVVARNPRGLECGRRLNRRSIRVLRAFKAELTARGRFPRRRRRRRVGSQDRGRDGLLPRRGGRQCRCIPWTPECVCFARMTAGPGERAG